ncbi:MAG: 30S ribosomal protein S21 [Candidatus Saganbacteria bacterium]|nr:30S ribosomal protein S21 [Candidatus Saganbacteria bacterium]
MADVERRQGESIEKVLRKFKMSLRKEGLLDEIRKREFYEKPSQRRRKKEATAKMKEHKRQQSDF